RPGTRGLSPCPRVLFDELRIRSPFDEADLLRLRLLRRRQASAARDLPDLRLRQLAKREQGLRQLLLRQTEQKVRLVLLPVAASQQQPPPERLIELHPRVVSRRDAIRSDARGLLDEVMKLDVVVAQDARARRLASKIRRDERRHDGG